MIAVHYHDLCITHKAFWSLEPRARFYDLYMKEAKDWTKWPDSVSLQEIEKLLRFIPKWDRHFRGKNPEKFLEVYDKILPIVSELWQEKLEAAKFDLDQLKRISVAFDAVAQYSELAYESTDCSKILHTILPHLVVMWDMKIRRGILGDENRKHATVYAFEFLPKMQIELKEAISNCIDVKGLSFEEAAKHIRQLCGFETLPKLIDEHNYVIHTKSEKFGFYLDRLKHDGEIRTEDHERLRAKLA